MAKLFSDILGQDTAVRMLSAQLESGDLSHAYIFLGSQGIGKEYLAKKFAKYILCPNRAEDHCDNCTRFNYGTHPDFIHIKGEEGIKIEKVREAIERINLSPNLSKMKVLLFSEAENMGHEAANALLKTFEEPPDDSVIILTAVNESSLLPTIVSRGRKVKLADLDKKDIQKILEKEFSKEEVERVISLSRGNIGRAFNMLDDTEVLKEEETTYNDAEKLVSSNSVIEKFKIIEEYDKKKTIGSFFDIFANLVFEAIQEKIKGEGENTDSNVFKKLNLDNLSAMGHKILTIYVSLGYNISLKTAMEEMVLDNLIVQEQ